jgi:hypothetical protein
MKRLIALALATTLALALLAACGGDDDAQTQEEGRLRAIGTLTENTVDAWVANGPEAIHNVLHVRIMDECSETAYLAIMEDEPQPTAWRNTKDITLSDDLESATATVVLVIDGQDVEQQWAFEVEAGFRWRVVDAPGVAECIGA